MKSKVVTREEALSRIHDGQTIMFGDWHGEFAADEIIDGMLEKGIKDIDAIAVSAGMADQGVGKLIKDHRVKSLITTHIGLNPIAKDQMFAGELAIEFSPQGTFAERIRCGGAGLGGCLTPTVFSSGSITRMALASSGYSSLRTCWQLARMADTNRTWDRSRRR